MNTVKRSDIQMVNLKSQYHKIKEEVDAAIIDVCENTQFIKGPAVSSFENNLAKYLDVNHVIGCANGTDALQIALMALQLKPGDEVIVPAFTYVATAEVIALLQLKPIMVDVDPHTFNIDLENLDKFVTEKTKVIVPVHLFGQSSDMEAVMQFAEKHNLYVIEDNAQAIGSDYTFSDDRSAKTGTIGHIGCTSFFPSKNLGCYGDGGAIFTNDDELAQKIRMVANHGQIKKYHHAVIGCNSRLDTIQAAVLDIKLRYLDEYSSARQEVASKYDAAFESIDGISIPERFAKSTHVFHQYTLKVPIEKRDNLIIQLKEKGIPTGVYYPIPLYKQDAFSHYQSNDFELPATEELCQSVISLPIHTEMELDEQEYIIESLKSFFELIHQEK
jgi:dTDP-4-amino-4,6-dideoxygalactose transaminase